MKRDPAGKLIWVRQIGGPGDDVARLVVDPGGSVFLALTFEGAVDFDPGPGSTVITSHSSSRDIAIVKLDTSGNLVWVKTIGGPDWDGPWSLALDNSGNIYSTGHFHGTVDFDPAGKTPSAVLTAHGNLGRTDAFIWKLDAAGNYVWARHFGGDYNEWAYGLDVDASGNCYASGVFFGTVDFDPGPKVFALTSTVVLGPADTYIVKFDPAGGFVWARQIGGPLDVRSWGLAVHGSGDVYAFGGFQGTCDFDPDPNATFPMTSLGDFDAFVAKLDAGGRFQWAAQFGGAGRQMGWAIHVDVIGNAYLAGLFRSTVDFDPGPGTFRMSSFGEDDVFVAKLDRTGRFRWAGQMGGVLKEWPEDIALDLRGNVHITGLGQGGDYDPGPRVHTLPYGGSADVFVATVSGVCALRNGNGLNPADFTPVNNPVLGRIWTTSFNQSASTVGTVLGIGLAGPATGPGMFGGEWLISLSAPPVLVFGSGDIHIPIPNLPALRGTSLSTQGARIEGGQKIVLLNAMDIAVEH